MKTNIKQEIKTKKKQASVQTNNAANMVTIHELNIWP
jgi:hypothetical protein